MTSEQRGELWEYVYGGGPTPQFVYEDFAESMPYGTQKARDGDPDNWLSDHWGQVLEYYENELEAESIRRLLRF